MALAPAVLYPCLESDLGLISTQPLDKRKMVLLRQERCFVKTREANGYGQVIPYVYYA